MNARYIGPLMIVTALAFATPVGIAVFLHRDEIFKVEPVDPRLGYMIFFTSPS